MKILIEFDCNNAAFTDDFHGEVASMLVQANHKIREAMERRSCACDPPESSNRLLDTNGNTVGKIEVKDG